MIKGLSANSVDYSPKSKWNVEAPPFFPSFRSPPPPPPPTMPKKNEAPVEPKVLSYSDALKSVKPTPGLLRVRPLDASDGKEGETKLGGNEAGNNDAGPSRVQNAAPSRKKKPSKSIPLGDFISLKISDNGRVKPTEKSAPSVAGNHAADAQAVRTQLRIPNEPKKNVKRPTTGLHGNILDSTAPVLHKGKQRENPKKKYSKMKKVILNERQHRRGRDTGASEDPAKDNQVSSLESDSDLDVSSPVADLDNEKNVSVSVAITSPWNKKSITSFCDNSLSKELDERVVAVIRELGRFQDRVYEEDPDKARMKKRLVYGLREVHKLLKVERIKCVIIAPNIEAASGQGGLDEIVADIVNTCRVQSVPYLFALTKMRIGYITHKHAPVSAVGIVNFQGADTLYKSMLAVALQAKQEFEGTSCGEAPAQ